MRKVGALFQTSRRRGGWARGISVWLKADDWCNSLLADGALSRSARVEAAKAKQAAPQGYMLLVLPDACDDDAALVTGLSHASDGGGGGGGGVRNRRSAGKSDALFATGAFDGAFDDEALSGRGLAVGEGDLLVVKAAKSSQLCACLRVADLKEGLVPWSHLVYHDEGASDFGRAEDVGVRAMFMTPADKAALLAGGAVGPSLAAPAAARRRPLLVHAATLATPVGDLAAAVERCLEGLDRSKKEQAGGGSKLGGAGGGGGGGGGEGRGGGGGGGKNGAGGGGGVRPRVMWAVGGELVPPGAPLEALLARCAAPPGSRNGAGARGAELALANSLGQGCLGAGVPNDGEWADARDGDGGAFERALSVNGGLPLHAYAAAAHPRGDECLGTGAGGGVMGLFSRIFK